MASNNPTSGPTFPRTVALTKKKKKNIREANDRTGSIQGNAVSPHEALTVAFDLVETTKTGNAPEQARNWRRPEPGRVNESLCTRGNGAGT